MHKTIALFALLASGVAAAFPWYANGGYRGAELMTPQERQEYVTRLQSMHTLNECNAYMNAHEAELQKRATAAHIALGSVKGDPCQAMLRMGRIKSN